MGVAVELLRPISMPVRVALGEEAAGVTSALAAPVVSAVAGVAPVAPAIAAARAALALVAVEPPTVRLREDKEAMVAAGVRVATAAQAAQAAQEP